MDEVEGAGRGAKSKARLRGENNLPASGDLSSDFRIVTSE